LNSSAQSAPQPRDVGFLHGNEIRIAMNLAGGGHTEFTYKVFKGNSYSHVGEYELKLFGYDVQIVNQCLVIITGHGERHIAQCYREQEKDGLNLVSSVKDAA
jgi:hypothetical protein